MAIETLPQPAGIAPSQRPKYAGTDDQCSFHDHLGIRCVETATDTVQGKLYCSPHADLVAGI